MNRRHTLLGLGGAALASLAGPSRVSPARAQAAFPSQPVKIVVPYPPGGLTDVAARLIGEQLQGTLGQPVVIENKAGAGTQLGAAMVAKAPADGHTLLLATVTTLCIAPALYARPMIAVSDFAGVALLGNVTLILVARPDLPAAGVKELMAMLRAKPGGMSFGSPGIGTTTHLIGEMIKVQSGVPMQHVAYKGASPALLDLVGGRLDFFMTGYSSAAAFLKDGRLRALAVTSERRSPQMPTVPTLTEAGLNDLTFGNWQGLVAPAGTPRPVIERLNTEFARAMQSDEARKIAATLALDPPQAMSPEQFGAIIKTDAERFAKAIKASGARAAD